VILVDSNILIDVIDDDPNWAEWSLSALEQAQREGIIAANTVVTAEVAPRFGNLQAYLDQLEELVIQSESITDEGAYMAGAAFRVYRARCGSDTVANSVLPDFLIGGHALSIGAAVLTRDPRFYRTYFPELTLITPETHP